MAEKEVRLIDARKITNDIALYLAENSYLNSTALDALTMVFRWVREAPSIDPETLRPHGKWIDKGYDGDWQWRIDGRGACWHVYECSVCKVKNCESKSHYCPHCGAKMDKEAQTE